MRAVRVIDGAEGAVLQQIETPRPGPGEVLVDISACGLNFADLLMVSGDYQATPSRPFTLGMEVAGVVRALGPGVTDPPVGQRVAAFVGHGGLAECGAFPADLCRALPDGMDDVTAAGFQVAYGTSHLALTRRARLRPGERLVVLGAAGGVGLTAVEIGAALGAEVVAVARGPQKGEIARGAGADHVLDAGVDLRAAIRDLGGADVLYDPVGGAAQQAVMRAMRPEGRVVVIGFASGEVAPIKANHLLVKNIDVLGFYWGGYRAFAPQAAADSMAELMAWHAEGRLRPHIGQVLDLDCATEGLTMLAARRATGKIVIKTRP